VIDIGLRLLSAQRLDSRGYSLVDVGATQCVDWAAMQRATTEYVTKDAISRRLPIILLCGRNMLVSCWAERGSR